MIEIIDFSPEDATRIVPQPAQASAWAAMGGAAGAIGMAARGPAWTAIDMEARRVVFVGGIAVCHGGYATAWSIFADKIGAGLVPITRRALAEIGAFDVARLDMFCSAKSAAAQIWAGKLGMTYEARLARAMPDGSDATVWVRLKGSSNG